MIALLSSVVVSARVGISTIALLAFEYIVTFDQEVQLIWMRKKTPASLLFLFICYHALVTQVFLNAASYSIMSDNMNWYLASLVFFLACGPFVINMWSLSYGVVGFNLPIVGCLGGVNVPTHAAHIGTILSRACTIVADLLVVTISWRYAAQGFGWKLRSMPTLPLTCVMILNGSAYFLALLVLNALHLTLTMLSIVGLSEPASDVTEFTDPLTVILICRFLLALHAANLKSSAVGGSLGTDLDLNIDQNNMSLRIGGMSELINDNYAAGQAERAAQEGTLHFAAIVTGSMGGVVGDMWDEGVLELDTEDNSENVTSATEMGSESGSLGLEQASSGDSTV
ncbi:hypothetical protein ACG7TL_005188 [Trametes sanguinea]